MNHRRSLQEWVLWLEMGTGARWVRRAALMLGIALLSLVVGYKQFRGPLSETTFAQAAVGRQVAQGEGFTTPVRYPQTLATLRENGATVDFDRPWPELHRPPLYSAAVAGALSVLPEKLRQRLFEKPPVPPAGFGADYVLLALNIGLFWLAAWLTFLLGRRVFDSLTGLWAALGLLLSATLWEQTVSVNGTPLMMVLLLGFFHAMQRIDAPEQSPSARWIWPLVAGIFCGLLFLGDYAAGIVLVPAMVYIGFLRTGRARIVALACVVAGFAVVATPWLARNGALTGNLFGLAGQSVALKAGDPTAEPEVVRNTLSAAGPALDLHKLGNKGLTAIQAAMRERFWAAGLFFSALFAVGLLYRFRAAPANRLRWLFVATLVALVCARAFFDSGEGERLPVVYAAPLVMIFGAGFFAVLVASSETLSAHARGAAALLLALQSLPLLHDVFEPRRLHFNYPPYYPGLFAGMREEMTRRGGPGAAWMCDVPAGAAWYSGQRVWSQPATLREFHAIGVDRPMLALVLTPHTLDKPFFSELVQGQGAVANRGTWSDVYAGLVTGRFPSGFPLSLPQKVSENLYVLMDPLVARAPGK